MISAGDFRKGIAFEWEDDIYEVVDFQHVKPGKGAAFVRTKVKSLTNGTNKETTFSPNERFPRAIIDTNEMQYLYNDGQLYYFMNTETYEQIPFDLEQVEDAIKWIRENDMATVRSYKGKPFAVEAPNFVELEVIETEPGIKGDTASGATKPATVETSYTLDVPLFVNRGDILRIDTRTGEYMSRS